MPKEERFKGPRLTDIIPISAIQKTIIDISKEIGRTRQEVLKNVGSMSPKDIWTDKRAMYPKIIVLLRAHLDQVIRLIRLSVRDEKDIEKEIGKKLSDAERSLLERIAGDERKLMKEALAYFNYWVATEARGEPLVGHQTLIVFKSVEREFFTKKIKDVLDQFLYDDETLEKDTDSFLHSLVRKAQ